MTSSEWKVKLARFFHDRGAAVEGEPTLVEHCVVSAKDPRIAARADYHEDMVASIFEQLGLDDEASVLEVGCASGYVACGLAPRIGRYTGVDLVATPLEVARRMGLTNAEFQQADGATLPFDSSTFDAAFAYDVFSNFPSFSEAEPLLKEMIRVVHPGGRVLAGSITDASKAAEFQEHVYSVGERLDKEFGTLPPVPEAGWIKRVKRKLRGFPAPPGVEGQIINFNFMKEDFQRFGENLELEVTVRDIHGANPYYGYRYNVVYTKSTR